MSYAILPVLLVAVAFASRSPDGPFVLLSLYGLPSSLLFPVVSFILPANIGWEVQMSLLLVFVAGVNGGLLYYACKWLRKRRTSQSSQSAT